MDRSYAGESAGSDSLLCKVPLLTAASLMEVRVFDNQGGQEFLAACISDIVAPSLWVRSWIILEEIIIYFILTDIMLP